MTTYTRTSNVTAIAPLNVARSIVTVKLAKTTWNVPQATERTAGPPVEIGAGARLAVRRFADAINKLSE